VHCFSRDYCTPRFSCFPPAVRWRTTRLWNGELDKWMKFVTHLTFNCILKAQSMPDTVVWFGSPDLHPAQAGQPEHVEFCANLDADRQADGGWRCWALAKYTYNKQRGFFYLCFKPMLYAQSRTTPANAPSIYCSPTPVVPTIWYARPRRWAPKVFPASGSSKASSRALCRAMTPVQSKLIVFAQIFTKNPTIYLVTYPDTVTITSNPPRNRPSPTNHPHRTRWPAAMRRATTPNRRWTPISAGWFPATSRDRPEADCHRHRPFWNQVNRCRPRPVVHLRRPSRVATTTSREGLGDRQPSMTIARWDYWLIFEDCVSFNHYLHKIEGVAAAEYLTGGRATNHRHGRVRVQRGGGVDWGGHRHHHADGRPAPGAGHPVCRGQRSRVGFGCGFWLFFNSQ